MSTLKELEKINNDLRAEIDSLSDKISTCNKNNDVDGCAILMSKRQHLVLQSGEIKRLIKEKSKKK